jgi:hypothetical protein
MFLQVSSDPHPSRARTIPEARARVSPLAPGFSPGAGRITIPVHSSAAGPSGPHPSEWNDLPCRNVVGAHGEASRAIPEVGPEEDVT